MLRTPLCSAKSKWRKDPKKGISLADFTRFRDGVRDVIALNCNNNNKSLHRFKSEIEEQLSDINTEVIMVLAHTSGKELSDIIKSKAAEFLDSENKYTPEFLSFREFRIKEAALAARSHTRPENISFELMLAHWGMLPSPYKAVYGSVSGVDVVGWFEQYGNKLFAENPRYGIEKSEVNDGIIGTAEIEPENFWYFNNGITAICDDVRKKHIGGPDTQSGVFNVEKISVINGAQTISSLHKAKQAGIDLSKIRVHFRVISLSETPDGFSGSVTSANNTQNDLNPVDFVAAAPNQDRIRKEAAQLGLVYSYRRGDKEPDRENGFTIRGATIAAACASGDLKLAVSAKRYISGLWENTKKEPYKKLFNSATSAEYLWRIVQIMYAVDDTLTGLSLDLSGRERLISVHSNRFLLYYVFEKMGLRLASVQVPLDQLKTEATELTMGSLAVLAKTISEKFPDAYPGNIFKNQPRQVELLSVLEESADSKPVSLTA